MSAARPLDRSFNLWQICKKVWWDLHSAVHLVLGADRKKVAHRSSSTMINHSERLCWNPSLIIATRKIFQPFIEKYSWEIKNTRKSYHKCCAIRSSFLPWFRGKLVKELKWKMIHEALNRHPCVLIHHIIKVTLDIPKTFWVRLFTFDVSLMCFFNAHTCINTCHSPILACKSTVSKQ